MHGIRIWARAHWVALLGFSLILRVAIAPWAYGFQYDMDTFGSWAQTLVAYPYDEFYAVAPSPDHLPGDLYLHHALGELFLLFGGENFHGDAYRFLLKLVPSVMDIAMAVVIWGIARRLVGEGIAREGALFYALNPATIFLSAVWGQWDVVSSLIMMIGLAIVWFNPSRWLLAIPLFAWAVMIKPPLALLCLTGLLALVLGDARRGRGVWQIVQRRFMSVVAASIIGIAMILVLILPFDTGLPGMDTRWSLMDRVGVAVDMYPYTTLGAANIWMIPLGSPDRVSDTAGYFLGLTGQSWGMVLFAGAIAYIAVVLLKRWRLHVPVTLVVWAMATANYAYFLLPTRSHERYMYPAVMLVILLATLCGKERRITWIAAAVSMVYFLNLVGVYYSFPGILAPMLFVTLSVLNIVLFVLIASFPLWSRSDVVPTGASCPAHASRSCAGSLP